MRSVCVYCGSNPGSDPAYLATATAFGRLLAQQGLRLVYGGGNKGLMGAVANGVLAAGGQVLGVIPQRLVEWEQAHTGLTEQYVVNTMTERKQMMAEQADGFVALPGGIGTLEEIFEAISWAQLGIHSKPCAFLNVNGYYDSLFAFLDQSVSQGLTRARTRQMILHDEVPERLLQRLWP
ncbi:MAG TPA: TIGR00730 family Rossman fold protein [Motiliproteus sp.]